MAKTSKKVAVKKVAKAAAAKPAKAEKTVVKKEQKPVKKVEKTVAKKEIKPAKKEEKVNTVKVQADAPVEKKKYKRKPPKKKEEKDEPILEPVPLIDSLVTSRRQKKSGPKKRTITNITLQSEVVIEEKPIIEKSKSGKLSYKLEYTIKSSPAILFDFVTTPSGLVQWFADKVDINGDIISFQWNGVEDDADILEWIEEVRVKYRWHWSQEDEFFQFRIYKNDITRDTILEIVDFAEPKEVEDSKRLWETQIKRLIKSIGG
jgi:uncharacterized protein YndB with AHSA1/START domain